MNKGNIIGVFHQYGLYRKTIIKLLSSSSDFVFEEIEHWQKLDKSEADLVIVFSPELTSEVYVELFKEMVTRIEQTVVLISNNTNEWMLDRKNIFYLERPTEEELFNNIKRILVLELYQ